MNKVTVALSKGRKTVEKVQIASSNDLESLFRTLKRVMINQDNNTELDFSDSNSIDETDSCNIPHDKYVPDENISSFIQSGAIMACVTEEEYVDSFTKRLIEHFKTILPENLKSELVDKEGIGISEETTQGAIREDNPTYLKKTLSDIGDIEGDKYSQNHPIESGGIMYEIKTIETNDKRQPEETRDAFFAMKCPKCGREKFFTSTTDNLYHCDCGETYKMRNYVPFYGKCPNCSNNVGTIDRIDKLAATLEGMDISSILRCSKCKSPVDFKYNEVRKRWVTL